MTPSAKSAMETHAGALPKPLQRRLQAMVRRVRRIAVLKGICLAGGIALASLLGIMALDASLTLFSLPLRWTLTFTALGLTAAAFAWWVLRPAFKPVTLTGVARYVEERHPELQETLSSAVQFTASRDAESLAGSRELIAEVIQAAERDASKLKPGAEFSAASVRPWALFFLALVAAMSLLFGLWPRQTSALLVRAVFPNAPVGNAYADSLTVTPGDVQVIEGSDLHVEVTIRHRRIQRATVRRLDPGQRREGVERMTLVSDEDGLKTFRLVFPNVASDFTYRVHAGAALSRQFQVDVLPPPAIEDVQVRYEYPDYTGLEPRETSGPPAEIVALENTVLTLEAHANRSMASALLKLGDRPMNPASPPPAQSFQWNFSLARDLESTWQIDLEDDAGNTNDPVPQPIRALRDAAPTIQLLSPEARQMKLRPSELVPLSYRATEDFGFSAAELVLEIGGRDGPTIVEQPLPVPAEDGSWTGEAWLDLSKLPLQNAATLRARLRLADSLPPVYRGPQIVLSEAIEIRIDRYAPPLAEQIFRSQEEEIRRTVREVKDRLQDASRSVERVKPSNSSENEENPLSQNDLEAIDQARQAATQAQRDLETLAEELSDTVFRDRARELADVAAEAVDPALESIETLPLTDEAADQRQLKESARDHLNDAREELDRIVDRLSESRDDVERVAELTSLALEQRRLTEEAKRQAAAAQVARARTPEEEQDQVERDAARELDQWRREQAEVQRDLGKLLGEDPAAREQALRAQSEAAQRMAAEARDLAERQDDLREAGAEARESDDASKLREALASAQDDVTRESERILDRLRDEQPQAAPAQRQLEEGRAQAEQAASQLRRDRLEEARDAAQNAEAGFAEAHDQAREEVLAEALTDEIREDMARQVPPENLTPEERKALDDLADALAREAARDASPNRSPQTEAALAEVEKAMESGEAIAEAARKAADALQADTPPGAGAPDAGERLRPDAALAEDLERLRERQEAIADALRGVAENDPEAALAALQENLNQEAAALERQAHGLQQATQAAQENQAGREAGAAEGQLDRATREGEQASQALQQASELQRQSPAEKSPQARQAAARAQQSQQAQNQAGQALADAGSKLENAAEQLQAAASAAQDQAPSPDQKRDALETEQLAEGYEQVSRATQADSAAGAAQQSEQAARQLQQMAQAAAQQLGGMKQAQSLTQTDQGSENASEAIAAPASGGQTSADLPEAIAQLGLSRKEWAQLKGTLDTDMTSLPKDGAPAEYRDLVRDYFRVLATQP